MEIFQIWLGPNKCPYDFQTDVVLTGPDILSENEKLFWDRLENDPLKYKHRSDILRFSFAARNKNVFYLDCDAKIIDESKLENSLKSSCMFPVRNDIIDYWAFWVGDDSIVFENILKRAINHTLIIMDSKKTCPRYWIISFLQKYKIDKLPDGTVIHK